MQILDMLNQVGGIESIARELGISEAEAANGAKALAPAILGGLKKQADSHPAGIEGLAGVLGKLGGGGLLDEVLSPQSTNVDRGNDVLGQIFGGKDVSRAVAQNAASQTGLTPEVLKKMLPILAMAVAGFMAKQRATGAATQASPAADSAGCSADSSAAGGVRRKAADSHRCSTSTATATLWTTS